MQKPRNSALSEPQPSEVLAAQCPGCGYTYDVVTGDEREGFAAGTAWADIPECWCCPDCGVRDKVDFVPVLSPPARDTAPDVAALEPSAPRVAT